MESNPFITRNNDLFTMLLAGMGINLTASYLLPLTVQAQFMVVLVFALCAGLMMNYLYQSLEWALFFLVGVKIVAVAPYALYVLRYGHFPAEHFIAMMMESFRYSFFLLSSWLVGIPVGFFIKKIVMDNYYRHRLF